jgi:hypothetical protein
MYPLQATVGTNRYHIVTAGGALIVFPGPSRCCHGMAIWSGGGGILVASDASFVPHYDPAALALVLARQVVHRRLGPGNDGNAEGPQGRGLTARRAPRRSP